MSSSGASGDAGTLNPGGLGGGGLAGSDTAGGAGTAGGGTAGGAGTAGGGTAGGGTAGGGTAGGGTAGGGTAGGGTANEVRVIRGDPTISEWWDLTIRGEQLTEFEGKLVTVRVGDPTRPPERIGAGQARIVQGAFEILLPQVWEAAMYKTKLAFIDADDDGRCNPLADRVFHDARGTQQLVLTLQNGADRASSDIPESSHPDEDCAVLNAAWPVE